MLVATLAAIAGSYVGFKAMQAIGPENRADEFGYGEAALRPPGGGTLLRSTNLARVVTALERELGRDGALESLVVKPSEVNAIAQRRGTLRYVDVDASGR